jgi:hypothetical protein
MGHMDANSQLIGRRRAVAGTGPSLVFQRNTTLQRPQRGI